jgi:hypothetical protein
MMSSRELRGILQLTQTGERRDRLGLEYWRNQRLAGFSSASVAVPSRPVSIGLWPHRLLCSCSHSELPQNQLVLPIFVRRLALAMAAIFSSMVRSSSASSLHKSRRAHAYRSSVLASTKAGRIT